MPSDLIVPGVLSTPGLGTAMDALLPKADGQQKTREAATDFEALLVGQILKSAHEEEGGWLGTGEDQTAGSAMQMADEYFARALTAHGGLGLAKMITGGLEKATADSVNRSNPASLEAPAEPRHKP